MYRFMLIVCCLWRIWWIFLFSHVIPLLCQEGTQKNTCVFCAMSTVLSLWPLALFSFNGSVLGSLFFSCMLLCFNRSMEFQKCEMMKNQKKKVQYKNLGRKYMGIEGSFSSGILNFRQVTQFSGLHHYIKSWYLLLYGHVGKELHMIRGC